MKSQLQLAAHQRLERHRFSLEESEHSIAKQKLVASVVVLERNLIEIALEMFDGELVIRTDERALKQGPRRLDGIGMYVGAHPFIGTMVHALVRSPAERQFLVGAEGTEKLDRLRRTKVLRIDRVA